MLMLALHRYRCLLHSTPIFQIRSLRTVPRVIPTYIQRWDPTLSKYSSPRAALTEPTALDDASKSTEREGLRDAHHGVVSFQEDSEEQQYAVERLNRVLHLVSSNKGRNYKRGKLWRAYMMARSCDIGILERIPDRAWDIIWSAQSVESSLNKKRWAHLEQLYRDMVLVGKTPTVGQRAKYLESVFLSGKEEQALGDWEEHHNSGVDDVRQDYKPEHLEIGAKLHALAGNADRSRVIMDELFRLYPTWDTSVMMLVFRAHTDSGLSEHHDVAREIYMDIKERKGDTVTLDDYDACLVGFLEAHHLPHAQQIFRDMVHSGLLTTSEAPTRAQAVLKRLHMLYRLGTDISKMTSIALDAITVLPPDYHGHLFGDWMKTAAVEKAPEAAAQILSMMFQRGYTPETFHFNMLLRALMRTKEDSHIVKAENIAWRMIEKAAQKPRAHAQDHEADSATEMSNRRPANTPNVDTEGAKDIPVGDVTTFALMMQHHAERLQWEHVDYLTRQLVEASIAPNVTIMNVLIDNKCRQGAYSEAWRIYKLLTDPYEGGGKGLYPDGATFRHLWKTLRMALGNHATRNDPDLPTPRKLVKEMVDWWTLSRSRYDAPRFLQGLVGADGGAIIALIMHCFSYTQDLPGSLVALHVLRQKFHILPTLKASEILQRQMAWVDMARQEHSLNSQDFNSRSNKENLERVVRVYGILAQRRLARMNMKAEDFADLPLEQRSEAELNLLSEFTRVMLKRNHPEDIVELMIGAATRSMGVPGLATGDMDASQVV
jgi:hypothetical protein